jgi:hypothetical protein
MLTIRKEQMAAFEEATRENFAERLVMHLRGRVSPTQPESWLRDQVRRGIREAPGYNLQTEQQVASFVETTCVVLGGFPESRLPIPALAILCAYGADPEIKLERYRQWAQQTR